MGLVALPAGGRQVLNRQCGTGHRPHSNIFVARCAAPLQAPVQPDELSHPLVLNQPDQWTGCLPSSGPASQHHIHEQQHKADQARAEQSRLQQVSQSSSPGPERPGQDRTQHISRRAAVLSAALAGPAALLASSSAATAATAPVVRPFCGTLNAIPPWAFAADWKEGTIAYAGFKTAYRLLGKPPPKGRKARSIQPEQPTVPLLVLHGGPGMPSRYLESLELLGVTNRPLVFYDQVGCGRSRIASEGKGPVLSRITPELFMAEVDVVREALGLDRVHLLGHGWGGMLALAYLTQGQGQAAEGDAGDTTSTSSSSSGQPSFAALPSRGIASLTLLSTPPSWEALVQDRRDKGQALGAKAWSALELEDGSEAYLEALRLYQQRHVWCQQPTLPGCLAVSVTSPSVNKAMTGGKMFQAGGALASWSVTPAGSSGPLPSLSGLPTLVVRGVNEELSEASTQALMTGPLAGADVALLELAGAGTMVHIDKHEELLERLDAHLKAADLKA